MLYKFDIASYVTGNQEQKVVLSQGVLYSSNGFHPHAREVSVLESPWLEMIMSLGIEELWYWYKPLHLMWLLINCKAPYEEFEMWEQRFHTQSLLTMST